MGYKGRALLEMGIQQALGAADPKRREAERLSAEYEKAATVVAELSAQRDELSVWELQARWSLDPGRASVRRLIDGKHGEAGCAVRVRGTGRLTRALYASCVATCPARRCYFYELGGRRALLLFFNLLALFTEGRL